MVSIPGCLHGAPPPNGRDMNTSLETDYLIVGAGATAMAFVDTLLTENAAPDPRLSTAVQIRGSMHTSC